MSRPRSVDGASVAPPDGLAAQVPSLRSAEAVESGRSTDEAVSPSKPVFRFAPALESPHFRLLWLGMLPATMAHQMGIVATGYSAYTLTGGATALGIVSVAMGLPMLVFSLIGGVVADRAPRRAVLLITQGVLALASGALAALAFAGALQVWHLFIFGAVQGTAFSFNMPARQAYIAEVVGPKLLRNALALNNAGMNFSRIVGPSLAGGILAVGALGVGGAFAGMSAMYAVVLLALLRLPPRRTDQEDSDRPRREGGWAQMMEGLGYVKSSPTLMALLALAFLPIFFGMPFQTLMPLFAEEVHGVGAAGLGALMTSVGVGALVGSLVVATLSGRPRLGTLQLGVGVGFGLSLVAFALAPSFMLAIAVLAVVGATSAAQMALNQTLVMANTLPRLHGRIMSVYMLTFALMPVATLPSAWLADRIGGPATIAGLGALVAGSVVAVALLYPPYRRIR